MSVFDTLVSRLSRPAGKALDPTIRDIVQSILKEHGYASPAEVQALRDEVRDMRVRIDGMASRLDAVVKQADSIRAEAASAPPRAPAPLTAEPRGPCKVQGCGGEVRSKGFCSAHYQQWRRGTLAGFSIDEGKAV